MQRTISFTLNGAPSRITVDDQRTLLWVLRSDLGLTGTKFGCGEALCGACTVIVNKQAVRACAVPMKDVAGKQVVTIEGLSRKGALHPIQEAFAKHHAFQCGYCTPGMLLSAYALLLKNPRPTREEIVRGMNDNLCRCGAHTRIVDAIEEAGAAMRASADGGWWDGAAGGVSTAAVVAGAAMVGMAAGSQADQPRHDRNECDSAGQDDSGRPDPHTEASGGVSRRDFLALAGAGLFVFFPVHDADAQERARGAGQGYPTDFNAYLKIGADGRVTCLVGKIEMGQGPMTSLAQLLADELDVAFDSVDMVMGDTDRCPWDMGTFGSLTTRMFGPVLRGAGAEARAVLLQMAAERLAVPLDRLQVEAGIVSDRSAPDQHVSYAELVQGRRIKRHLEKAPLKPVSAFQVVGQSPRRKDTIEKITGKAKYAGDVMLSEMLHARIVRGPAHGATLKSADTTAAEKIAGVRVVRDGDLIAVLHERRDVAGQALDLVRAEFERPRQFPAGLDDRNIYDHLLKASPPARVVGEGGSLAEGEKLAATIVENTYVNSYVAHAPIETHSATAVTEAGKATVWASTQTPFSLKQQVAQALGYPPENVRVITPYVGGGFGGKSAGRQAVEAARLAKATGRPVQVVWERAEEFFYDTFRPAAVIKVRSGVNAAGKLVLWDFHVYCAGDREAKHFYDIPHHRTTSSAGWMGGNPRDLHPFAVGPWRAPSVNSNTFARESQIDIMASRLGLDPVEFRLNNLADKRMRRVLEAAANRFGWKAAPAPSGRGVGVALGIDSGSYVATMIEASVDKRTGHVEVKRVVCAEDAGVVVNPDGMRQQMEGCITMGLGYALTEGFHFKDGAALDRNFDTYEVPRFTWLPKIETVLVENNELPSQGGGEPPIVVMGAVVANAIHDAAGIRLLELPMTPARVKA